MKISALVIRMGERMFSGGKFAQLPGVHFVFSRVHKFLSRKARLALLSINGFRFTLDENDSLRLSVYEFEPEVTRAMQNAVKEGDVVCDVGANIGYYTLLLSRWVGISGHVYAFEPDPSNFKLLKKNVEDNNLQNVSLEQKALVDNERELTLYLNPGNHGDNRIADFKGSFGTVRVKGITLDSYLKNPPDFVKMDIQGAELIALQGMSKTMPDKMIIETDEKSIAKARLREKYEISEIKDGNFLCVRKQ